MDDISIVMARVGIRMQELLAEVHPRSANPVVTRWTLEDCEDVMAVLEHARDLDERLR